MRTKCNSKKTDKIPREEGLLICTVQLNCIPGVQHNIVVDMA